MNTELSETKSCGCTYVPSLSLATRGEWVWCRTHAPVPGGFVCSKCGAEPAFSRRVSWGFNMADAFCPTKGCPGGVFSARDYRDGHGCPDCPPLPARCQSCDGFGTCLHCDGGSYRSPLCKH